MCPAVISYLFLHKKSETHIDYKTKVVAGSTSQDQTSMFRNTELTFEIMGVISLIKGLIRSVMWFFPFPIKSNYKLHDTPSDFKHLRTPSKVMPVHNAVCPWHCLQIRFTKG